MACKAGLPRRTVQYWHDKEIIIPLSKSPVVYSDDELRIVRLLSGFGRVASAISVIKEMARVFRLIMEEDSSVPSSVSLAFSEAMKGQKAYFLIAPDLDFDGDELWAGWSEGVVGESALGPACARFQRNRPSLHLHMINLEYALNLNFVHGTAHSTE